MQARPTNSTTALYDASLLCRDDSSTSVATSSPHSWTTEWSDPRVPVEEEEGVLVPALLQQLFGVDFVPYTTTTPCASSKQRSPVPPRCIRNNSDHDQNEYRADTAAVLVDLNNSTHHEQQQQQQHQHQEEPISLAAKSFLTVVTPHQEVVVSPQHEKDAAAAAAEALLKTPKSTTSKRRTMTIRKHNWASAIRKAVGKKKRNNQTAEQEEACALSSLSTASESKQPSSPTKRRVAATAEHTTNTALLTPWQKGNHNNCSHLLPIRPAAPTPSPLSNNNNNNNNDPPHAATTDYSVGSSFAFGEHDDQGEDDDATDQPFLDAVRAQQQQQSMQALQQQAAALAAQVTSMALQVAQLQLALQQHEMAWQQQQQVLTLQNKAGGGVVGLQPQQQVQQATTAMTCSDHKHQQRGGIDDKKSPMNGNHRPTTTSSSIGKLLQQSSGIATAVRRPRALTQDPRPVVATAANQSQRHDVRPLQDNGNSCSLQNPAATASFDNQSTRTLVNTTAARTITKSTTDTRPRADTEPRAVLHTSSSFMRVNDLNLPWTDNSPVGSMHSLSSSLSSDTGHAVASQTTTNCSSTTGTWMRANSSGPDAGFFFIDQNVPLVMEQLFKLGYDVVTDESDRFEPLGETKKLLQKRQHKQPPAKSPVHQYQQQQQQPHAIRTATSPDGIWPVVPWHAVDAMSDDIFVWKGGVPHKGVGHDWPVIKCRTRVQTTPRALLDVLLDSSQIKRYNKLSQGRQDVLILQQGVDTPKESSPYGVDGDVRILRALNKPRLLPKTIEVLSVWYTKQLVEAPGSYMTVSRSVWEDNSGLHKSDDNLLRSEMLLGVTLLRPIPAINSDGTDCCWCEITTITHVFSPGVNDFLAKRSTPGSAMNLLRDIQALFADNSNNDNKPSSK